MLPAGVELQLNAAAVHICIDGTNDLFIVEIIESSCRGTGKSVAVEVDGKRDLAS